MESRISGGRIVGLPYHRYSLDINSADMAQIIPAATGLIKTVAKTAIVTGAVGLGATALLALLCANAQESSELSIPLGSGPCFIQCSGSEFWGVILDEEVRFSTSSDLDFTVPLAFVSSISTSYKKESDVRLCDGSWHYCAKFLSGPLTVATVGGPQRLSIRERIYISPIKIDALESLRDRMRFALQYDRAAITALIGEEELNAFFNLNSLTQQRKSLSR